MFRSIALFFQLALLTLQRLWSRPGLTLLNLLGIILAVGLLSSTAFFTQAVDRVILTQELAELSRVTGRLPFSTRIYFFPSSRKPVSLVGAETVGQDVAGTLSGEIGLPIGHLGVRVESGGMMLLPQEGDTRYGDGNSFLGSVELVYVDGIGDHMEIVDGDPLSEDEASGEELDIWMHVRQAEKMGVHAGEKFSVAINLSQPRRPVRIRGLWQAKDPEERYWFNDPDTTMLESMLVRRQDYISWVQPLLAAKSGLVSWHIILDDRRLNPANARQYAEGFEIGMSVINQYLPGARLDLSALDPLKEFVVRQTTLTTLLLGFNVPAFGFLLAFLILVSVIIAEWQRRETAILVSRGMGVSNILGLVLIEEFLLFVVGIPAGIGFGMLIARGMGYTASFLSFIEREPLPVSLQGLDPRLIVIALAFALLSRIIPAFAASRSSVVEQAREQARPLRGPFWQRTFMDVILILPTYYAYDQLAKRGTLARLVEDKPEQIFQDPLLILVPALFVLTTALLSMRLFPILMRMLDLLASRMPLLTLHLALRQLGRYSQGYTNPLLLVIVSLALGIYTFSLAASLDQWLVDRMYYSVGADVAFEPYRDVEGGGSVGGGASAGAEEGGAGWIPPKDEFAQLPGVLGASRVGRYSARIASEGSRDIRGQFLGIDRVDFPEIAWFRSDFAGESLGAMMNRLALAPENILVSQRLLEQTTLRIGEQIRIKVSLEDGIAVTAFFTIAGVYTYFPTVYPERETIIGNLDHLFFLAGSTFTHDIWLRTKEAQGDRIQNYEATDHANLLLAVEKTGVEPTRKRDASELIADEQGKFERVGIFGTLTVGFLAASVMATLALLLHSYASLQERLYQFGVLRAVGLMQRQVIWQVILEYSILTACGAIAGAWIGSATARLFAPFFRIVAPQGIETQLAAPLPPLLPVIAQDEIIVMAILFASAMVVVELGIIVYALSRRLFDSLRMGHQG